MRQADETIPDFSDLTCTNLMIRLKMLLRKAPAGTPVVCYVRRDQKDTVETPFSRFGYDVKVHKADTNRYRVSLTKREQDLDL
jgi:DNA-binding response OmpR family regulator